MLMILYTLACRIGKIQIEGLIMFILACVDANILWHIAARLFAF